MTVKTIYVVQEYDKAVGAFAPVSLPSTFLGIREAKERAIYLRKKLPHLRFRIWQKTTIEGEYYGLQTPPTS